MATMFVRIAVLLVSCAAPAACGWPPPKTIQSDAQFTASETALAKSQDAQAAAATRGLAYAKEHCGSCHLIAGGLGQSPDPHAPSFETIANTPGMTPTALNVWLHSAHPSMPNLVTDPNRFDDLSAYIITLRRGKTRG